MEHNFRTEVPEEQFPFFIDHHTPLLLLGSCFSQHIGKLLTEGGFATVQNPFGITYNPLSLLEQLEGRIDVEDYFEKNGLYAHYSCHGSLASTSEETLEKTITTKKHLLELTLHQENLCVLLTFGTSTIYELMGTSTVVNNCHKQPDTLFHRRMLSVEEIVTPYMDFLRTHLGHFPEHRFLFTVSPIRHLRDGLHKNTLSKATLHLAIEKIVRAFPEHCMYFPSYELLMDDLRDYRFYDEDMLHPAPTAIAYIWNYFLKGLFSKETQHIYTQILSYVRFAKHRVLQEKSTEYKEYVIKKEHMKEELTTHFPFLQERDFFRTL